MKRKMVSFILCIAMCMSLAIPAFAVDKADEENNKESFFGYTFTEQMLANGDWVIESYYNGQIQKRYTIVCGDDNILVENKSEQVQKENYTIPKVNTSTTYNVVTNDARAEQWAHKGYINYSPTTSSYPGTVRAYIMAYGNSKTTTLPLEVKKNTPFDDVVSIITSYVISEGFSKLIIAAGYAVTTWAGAFVVAIAAAASAEIVEGVIRDAFTEKVKAFVTTWDFKATPFMENDIGDTVYLRSLGTTTVFQYSDGNKWDEFEDGVTFKDWQKTSLARSAWSAMFPNIAMPVVKNFTNN